MMETLSRVSRTLTLILIIGLLCALTLSVRELTQAVIDQRTAIEATINIAGERCQLDARMKELEESIDSMRSGTIMFKLSLPRAEPKDAE